MTVNSERYIEMMRRKFLPTLRRRSGIDINIVVFQQEEALPSFALIELFNTLDGTSTGTS